MEIDKEQFETLLASLPENHKPDPDPILLQENNFEIDRAHRATNKALAALVELNSLCGIDSFEKLDAAQNDVTKFIHGVMLLNPTIKKLAENIPINLLNVPPNLQRAETLLGGVIDRQFLFFTDGEWQINFDALESYLEQFRFYAKSVEQLEKFFLTKGLCEYLNSLNIGTYSRHAFCNSMMQIAVNPEGTYGFIPDTNWILSENKTAFRN